MPFPNFAGKHREDAFFNPEEYVAYLRLQASQIASGQLVTMSRQHPGVQLRAWLDTMSFSRRKGVSGKQAEDGLASQLMALSS